MSQITQKNSSQHIVLLFLSSFLAILALGMQTPTLSLFAVELGSSIVEVGLIVSVGFAVRLVLRVPIGLLSDRFGRKDPFCFGIGCITISLFTLHASSTPLHIMISQFACALAFTTIYSIGITMAQEAYPSSPRTGVAAFTLASGIAGVGAPLLCSALLVTLPIRTTYFIGGIIGAAGFACSLLVPRKGGVRESLEPRRSLQSVISNKGVQLVCAIQVLSILSETSITTYLPLRASIEMGLSASTIALLMSAYSIGMVFIRIPASKIFKRLSATKLLTIALLVFTISVAAIPSATEPFLLMVLVAMAGVAHGMIWPVASIHLSSSVGSKDLGLANAIYGATGDAVGVSAPIPLSSIVGFMGYSALYYTVFLFDLIGVVPLVMILMRSSLRQKR